MDPTTTESPADHLKRPGVVIWFKAYVALNLLIYLAMVGFGFWVSTLTTEQLAELGDPQDGPIVAFVFLAMGGVLAIPFAIALFLPRRRWAWVYGLVLNCFGLASCFFWLFSIPLLIFWIQQPARAWFGWGVEAPTSGPPVA